MFAATRLVPLALAALALAGCTQAAPEPAEPSRSASPAATPSTVVLERAGEGRDGWQLSASSEDGATLCLTLEHADGTSSVCGLPASPDGGYRLVPVESGGNSYYFAYLPPGAAGVDLTFPWAKTKTGVVHGTVRALPDGAPVTGSWFIEAVPGSPGAAEVAVRAADGGQYSSDR